jgi:mannose-1-phosphate guanylyltransferase
MPFGAARNMVSIPDGKLAVIQGLEDYIIVDTDDVLLICRKEDEQQIRMMVDEVKIKLGNNYI